MSTAAPHRIDGATLRANPRYELVPLERIATAQRAALSDGSDDEELYGLLRPRSGSGSAKSVSCDVALLWHALAAPGPLPHFARRKFGIRASDHVVQLVLDEVLEVELEGEFVGGARALERLGGARAERGTSSIARMSIDALRFAEELDTEDVGATCAWLYSYNRAPRTPQLAERWSDTEAYERETGLERSAVARTLGASWSALESEKDAPKAWRVWLSKRRGSDAARATEATYKLYLSPELDHFAPAFERALAVLTELGVAQFKIGADLAGLLRPDKFVAYFASFEELANAASRLRPALAGVSAQGVPFSASIGDGALLSWGIDPPSPLDAPVAARESWRLWVTRRLAASLVEARAADRGALAPWEFALERLHLEGVDTAEWTPSVRTWDHGRNLRN